MVSNRASQTGASTAHVGVPMSTVLKEPYADMRVEAWHEYLILMRQIYIGLTAICKKIGISRVGSIMEKQTSN